MAQSFYVSYSEPLDQLFQACHVTISLRQYGSNTGWDYNEFITASTQVADYLFDNPDGWSESLIEEYMGMLDGIVQNAWSTEGIIIG